MYALYDHPDHSWGHLSVTEPDPAVDEPPRPDEETVCRVYFEPTDPRSVRHWVRCQVCPKTVCRAYPHIMEFV